jgi:hypothetical protein
MDEALQSYLTSLEALTQQNALIISNLQTEIAALKRQNVEDEKTLPMLRVSSIISRLIDDEDEGESEDEDCSPSHTEDHETETEAEMQ